MEPPLWSLTTACVGLQGGRLVSSDVTFQEFFFKTPHSKSKRPYITLAKGLISNVSQKALYSMHKNKL